MINIVNLVLIFALFVSILSRVKLFFRYFLLFILSIFLCSEFFCLYLTGKLLDYIFITNFSLKNYLLLLKEFTYEIPIFIIFFLISFYLLNFVSKKIIKSSDKVIYSIIIFLILIIIFFSSILEPFIFISKGSFESEKNIDNKNELLIDFLNKNGLNEISTFDSLIAKPGKNIIVLSLESLENSFIEGDYTKLTPFLSSYKKEQKYFKLTEDVGWTLGSLFLLMTGNTAYFSINSNPNTWLLNHSKYLIPGFANVLKKADYDMKYFMSNISFAGTDVFLKSLGFEIYSEKNHTGNFTNIYDFSVFSELKKHILEAKNQTKPFAYFLSTSDTHFNGNLDKKTIKNFKININDYEDNIEIPVRVLDYLIEDFVNFLKVNDLLENTNIYIFPDHLLMGKSKTVKKLNEIGDRKLYLISNASSDEYTPVNQRNISKYILESSGITSNLVTINDLDPKLLNDKSFMRELNEKATIKNKNNYEFYIKELTLFFNDLETFKIKKREDVFYFLFDENGELLYKSDKEHDLKRNLKKYNKTKTLALYFRNFKFHSYYFGDYYHTGKVKKISNPINLSLNLKLDDFKSYQNEITNLIFEKNASSSKKIKNKDIAYISSSSFSSATNNGIESSLIFNNIHFDLNRGLNLCYVLDNDIKVINFDVYDSRNESTKLYSELKKLIERNVDFLLILDDAIKKKNLDKNLLKNIGLNKLFEYKNDDSYIAVYDGNDIKEYIHPQNITYEFLFKNIDKNKITYESNKLLDDHMRFIAHAGGMIEGYKYTNSLESLKNSYNKGFKLIELDLIKTSDNFIVAAHDWKFWKKVTNYKGKIPPTYEDFMNHKIYGRFTPLDMNSINNFFEKHHDAILVTDKINDPELIINKFTDPDRLFMELFSEEAVREAHKLKFNGIMPSGKVFFDIKNKDKFINEYKFDRVAFSIGSISKNDYDFFKENNIKVYLFNINKKHDGMEMKTLCFNKEFYGMYVDDLDFKSDQSCY